MAKRPATFEREFIAAADEFGRRQLWKRFANDDLFLIRVPTEEDPLVSSIMGAGGDEFGIGIARGPDGFAGYVDLCDGGPGEDFAAAGDLLSVVFDRWCDVPDEFRRTLLRAGPQPRREKVVPVAFVSPPFEATRPASRAELRTLLWALRGILAADDAGLFEPFELDEDGRTILELRVDGQPKRPTVTTEVVPWPDVTIDAPPLSMLPADLARRPRHGERWLATSVGLPAMIEGDARLTSVGLLAIEHGPLLGTEICQGADLGPVVALLVSALRGECPESESEGLPREIVFGNERLFDTLAPALAALGVATVLDLAHPELERLGQGLSGAMDAFLEEHEPGSLEDWQQKSVEATALLMAEVEEKGLITPRALQRYFGEAQEGEALLEEFQGLGSMPAFLEWLVADYRAVQRSKTVVEKRLARKRISPEERVLLQARLDATLSFFRVDSTVPGESLEVEDVLTGERSTLQDGALSQCRLEGCILPLRLMRVEGFVFPLLAGPPLETYQLEPALSFLEGAHAEITPEDLKRDSELFGMLWSWWRDLTPPRLANTDGDELALQDACFRLDDPAVLQDALAERGDLRFDEDEGLWVWSRPDDARGSEARTLLGRLTPLDDRLLLEVNSRERLEQARSWLEAIPGVRLESFTARDLEQDELPLDDRLPSEEEGQLAPEDAEHLRDFMLDHYRRWVDEPVPMLGGRTPRQACESTEGRRKVERMVRSMPGMQTPAGEIAAPREEILRELGITKDA